MGITAKQKEIFDYINNYLTKHGYSPTQREIKEHFSFKSFGSVQRYINYLVDAGLLEEANWNERRGLRPKGAMSEGELRTTTNHSNFEEIPLLGKIAAGAPIEAIEQAHHLESTPLVSVPANFIKRGYKYFALQVEGSSMIEDGILEGDLIICKSTNHAERGETVIALIDGEATVKHFYPQKEFVELRPANSAMKPIRVTTENFKIAGTLVGLIRSYV